MEGGEVNYERPERRTTKHTEDTKVKKGEAGGVIRAQREQTKQRE